jgi:ribosomal protein S6--L-glutamate ligase
MARARARESAGRADAQHARSRRTAPHQVPRGRVPDHRRRFGVLVERRYLTQAQPAGMTAALQARDHEVVTIDPEAVAAEAGDGAWLDDIDLVVARGRSLALFCLLTCAEKRGTTTINRTAAITAVHNKAEMAITLATADVPTPKTFLGRPDALVAEVPSKCYPLIVKPSFGDNGQGLRIVESPSELAELRWPEPIALVQQFLATDGNDLKLYAIGDEVWAVRKPSPLRDRQAADGNSFAWPGAEYELVTLSPGLRELGRRCGELFGLELYGVDCLETAGGTVVIEVNEFPNYTGVPAADSRLADYVVFRAERERERPR